MTLEQFLDEQIDYALDYWDAVEGETIPMFVLLDRAGLKTVIGAPYQSDEEEQATLVMLRGLMKIHETVRYAFICPGMLRDEDGHEEEILQVIVADRHESLSAAISVTDDLKVRKMEVIAGSFAELLWEGRRDH